MKTTFRQGPGGRLVRDAAPQQARATPATLGTVVPPKNPTRNLGHTPMPQVMRYNSEGGAGSQAIRPTEVTVLGKAKTGSRRARPGQVDTLTDGSVVVVTETPGILQESSIPAGQALRLVCGPEHAQRHWVPEDIADWLHVEVEGPHTIIVAATHGQDLPAFALCTTTNGKPPSDGLWAEISLPGFTRLKPGVAMFGAIQQGPPPAPEPEPEPETEPEPAAAEGDPGAA